MGIKNKSIAVLFIMLLTLSTVLVCMPTKVEATEIAPFTTYNPNPVSFYGNYTFPTSYYAGNNFVCEASATSSDGVSRTIVITIKVINTNSTYQYSTTSDGTTRRTPNVPINGGSNVIVSASCSDSSVKITLDAKMYSS